MLTTATGEVPDDELVEVVVDDEAELRRTESGPNGIALCAAKAAGAQGQVPRKAKSKPPKREHRHVAVVQQEGRILFVRAPDGLLRGLWTLPAGAKDKDVAQHVLEQAGVQVQVHAQTAAWQAKHQFSHRTWIMEVHRAEVVPTKSGANLGSHASAWIPVADLHRHAIPVATKVALAAAGIPITGTTTTTTGTTTAPATTTPTTTSSISPKPTRAGRRAPKRAPGRKAAKPKTSRSSARP